MSAYLRALLRTLRGMASTAKRAQSRVEAVVLRRFREVLAGRRISQVELAERVGLSRVQLNRILNGHKPATFTEAVDIARALDLDLADVVAQAQREVGPGERPALRFPPAAEVAALELRLSLDAESAGEGHGDVTGASASGKEDPNCG